MFAATGGDDYALLLSLAADFDPTTLCLPEGTRISRIGRLAEGPPTLSLSWHGEPVQLPERLGFEHSSHPPDRFSAPPMDHRP
jgi:thiamine-monophosphate kinase